MLDLRDDTLPARSNTKERYCVVQSYIYDESHQQEENVELIQKIDQDDKHEWGYGGTKQYEVEHSFVDLQSMALSLKMMRIQMESKKLRAIRLDKLDNYSLSYMLI